MPLVLSAPPAGSGPRFISPEFAARQEIRPLRVLVLDGERDGELLASWLALLSNTPLQIEILLDPTRGPFDGVVAWGTPAALPHGIPALLVGETARHALAADHGLIAEPLTRPLAEILPHRIIGHGHPLVAGHEPVSDLPIARDWRIGADAVTRVAGAALVPLASSPRAGVHLIHEPATARLYVLTQIGWSPLAYARHLRRVQAADPLSADDLPPWTWRAHAHLVVGAWLDLLVYLPASIPASA